MQSDWQDKFSKLISKLRYASWSRHNA